jgi:hypothetical protein
MVKDSAFEIAPPLAEVATTVTEAEPGLARSVAGIAAVTCVGLTKVVVRLAPFHCTVEPLMNPVPFTVRVRPTPPVTAAPGDSVARDAAGAGLTVKFVAADVAEVSPLSVFTTVMGTVPVAATSDAGIATVSCVELTTVVAVCFVPFHAT